MAAVKADKQAYNTNSTYNKHSTHARSHSLYTPDSHIDRSFTAAAGPRLWNELPADLRRPSLTFPVFKQKLKTHLFGLACS